MCNAAARSERSAARTVVAEILFRGAFLLIDRSGLWISPWHRAWHNRVFNAS